MPRDANFGELVERLRGACEAQDERKAKASFDALDDAHGDDTRLRGMFLDAYCLSDERQTWSTRAACMRRLHGRCSDILTSVARSIAKQESDTT